MEVIRERAEGRARTLPRCMRTGRDMYVDGVFKTPYQYTEEQLKAAVTEANRYGLGPGHGVGGSCDRRAGSGGMRLPRG